MMSRHCSCYFVTLNIDVTLLLKLCSNVATLSSNVLRDSAAYVVAILKISTLPISIDVAAMSRH